MGRIPDQIEQWEESAENAYYKMTDGVPDGKMKCSCGRIEDEDNFHPISAHPYAMPVCGSCCEEHFKHMEK